MSYNQKLKVFFGELAKSEFQISNEFQQALIQTIKKADLCELEKEKKTPTKKKIITTKEKMVQTEKYPVKKVQKKANDQYTVEVGDYFVEIWSAVQYAQTPVVVTQVYTQSKVRVEGGSYGPRVAIITKRTDGIWRKQGVNKKKGSGKEVGTRYIYAGKQKPETIVPDPYYD